MYLLFTVKGGHHLGRPKITGIVVPLFNGNNKVNHKIGTVAVTKIFFFCITPHLVAGKQDYKD